MGSAGEADTGAGAADSGGSAGSGAAGSGGTVVEPGAGGQADTGSTVTYAARVGAAYPNRGDARLVLVDATGSRSVLFNQITGAFFAAQDLAKSERGLPFTHVAAIAGLDDATYYFDDNGQATVFDRATAAFSAPAPVGDVLPGLPFPAVGATFSVHGSIFVFDAPGTSYAAFVPATGTWSPVYNFATDFGGGGAPFPNVGAACADSDGIVWLFDAQGDRFTEYDYARTRFSSAFDVADLGDGTLNFNDAGNP